MFYRLLLESFRRQRRRKLLAGVAILLGTTAVTAMLALATTIGDRIHKELAVYGANIVVYPKADLLDVKIGGVDVKPGTGGSYLKESDPPKLKTIFWANNITGISPALPLEVSLDQRQDSAGLMWQRAQVQAVGLWFNKQLAKDSLTGTGAPALHPWWKIQGRWPSDSSPDEIAIGAKLEGKLQLSTLNPFAINGKTAPITGTVSTGDAADNEVLMTLARAQTLSGRPDAVSRVEVS